MLRLHRAARIAPSVSDTLCRLPAGGGFATRRVYTDQEETLFDAMRPMILNGITDVISQPDLAHLAVVLTLEPIAGEARRPEAEIWVEIESARPQILGGLGGGHCPSAPPERRLDRRGLASLLRRTGGHR